MSKYRTKLTNLRLRRIDFVDEGDNPGALITLAKARDARLAKAGAMTTGEAVNRREIYDALQCLYSALSEAVSNNLYSDAQPEVKAANIKTSVEQFAAALTAQVDEEFAEDAADVVEVGDIALVVTGEDVFKLADTALGRALRVVRKIAGQTLHVPDIDPAFKGKKNMADDPKDKDEKDKKDKEAADLKAKFAKRDGEAVALEAEVVTLKARVIELEKAAETPEAIEKRKHDALPVEVRKEMDENRAEIKKLRDASELVEFTKQATELGMPGTTPEKLAPVLRSLAKALEPEPLAEVVRLFKSAAEMAKRGNAFNGIGSPGVIPQGDGSALVELSKRIGEVRAANPKLDFESAHNQVMQSNIDLAQRVAKERAGVN